MKEHLYKYLKFAVSIELENMWRTLLGLSTTLEYFCEKSDDRKFVYDTLSEAFRAIKDAEYKIHKFQNDALMKCTEDKK